MQTKVESKYRVVWEVEVSADTPREAAEQALAMQRDADALATVFSVYGSNTSEPVVVDVLVPGEN